MDYHNNSTNGRKDIAEKKISQVKYSFLLTVRKENSPAFREYA
jgi:hypothetical protein